MTKSNYVKIDSDTAEKNVREAGRLDFNSQSKMAWALMGVFQQAYEGNLNPAITLAQCWTETNRKRAAAILGYATSPFDDRCSFKRKNADLRIVAPEGDKKPARLISGWDTRKMDWLSFEEFEKLILASCPVDKKDNPKRNRASIREMEKLVKPAPVPTDNTLTAIEARTVKAVNGASLPGVPEEYVAKVIGEAFAKLDHYSKEALKHAEIERAKAEMAAKAKKEKAKANKAQSKKGQKQPRKKAA